MRYASGSAIAERRLTENRILSCPQEFCQEAGEYVAPGGDVENEKSRCVTLAVPDFLPVRLDGPIASYRRTRRSEPDLDGWALSWNQVQFEALVARTRKRLYLFARRGLGNAQEAEDITQETLTRAWTHFDSFDRKRSFEAWVFRIAHNLMVDQSRLRHKRPLSLDTSIPPPKGWAGEEGTFFEIANSTADPVCCLMKEEISAEMDSALDSLPPLLRKTLLLLAEKQSYQQIARACDCSIGTVRSRAHRARVLMRRCLQEGRLHG